MAVLFSFVLLSACRKEPEELIMIIEGRVTDSAGGQGVQGVFVSLSQKALEDGAFVAAFQPVSSVVTSGDGFYRFEFKRANASAYRLEFNKALYFPTYVDINPDLLRPDIPFAQETSLDPVAWARTIIRNNLPESLNDLISFNYVNADFACSCCSNEQLTLSGMLVDTSFICALPGNYKLKYFINVEKDSSGYVQLDSIICSPFDTTYIDISY